MSWGAWVAQSVKRLTLAQVMISRIMSSSPTSGSVLTAPSLESASDSVSLSLCPSLARALSLSLSLSRMNKILKKNSMMPTLAIPSRILVLCCLAYLPKVLDRERDRGILETEGESISLHLCN